MVDRQTPKRLAEAATAWLLDRLGLDQTVRRQLSQTMPSFATSPWYYLGTLTIFSLATAGFTGILMAFFYTPSVTTANASVHYIREELFFGELVIHIHAWSANLTLLLIIAHMSRVIIVGAYKAPRELNWYVGLFLLLIVVMIDYTGYLLPWDQHGFWAAQVGTNLLNAVHEIPIIGPPLMPLVDVGREVFVGGPEIGQATLTRFYVMHVLLLPALLVGGIVLHLWLLNKHGFHRPGGPVEDDGEDEDAVEDAVEDGVEDGVEDEVRDSDAADSADEAAAASEDEATDTEEADADTTSTEVSG